MPECPDGCFCDDCCKKAREFALGHWNLRTFDDDATAYQHARHWIALGEGYARKPHRVET